MLNLLNPVALYVAIGLLRYFIQPNESAILLFPLVYNYGISNYQYVKPTLYYDLG